MKKLMFMAVLLTSKIEVKQEYTLVIPRDTIGSFWNLVNGEGDKVSVSEYKEITRILAMQINLQSEQFRKQDSIAKIKK